MAFPYVGELRIFAGNFAPVGWAICDGSLRQISQYSTLFNLIGTTYGGDGTSTFGLPNLLGRALIHQGAGPNGTQNVIGQQLGTENVMLLQAQLPSHNHTVGATTAPATSPTPSASVMLAATVTNDNIYDGAATPVSLSPAMVGNYGGSQPHPNRQPYLAITYIIALEGIYPPQS